MSAMWKPNETATPTFTPPEHARTSLGMPVSEPIARPAVSAGDQATIGKSLVFTGEIVGAESLFIDGKVEGSINLPDNRVTVGRNGKVNASINAREIVVLGIIRGNVSASDRVDIRAEGALTGDVAAARISVEDGAFFKGGIDIRKPVPKQAAAVATPTVISEASKPIHP
jgi:cytoskeletal protein CcmA (bactofilin family)